MLLQDAIHKLEVGSGSRYVRYAAGLLAMLALAVFYDVAAFKNLSAPEAMDSAQLARNIAEGRGYTTLFVRPLSIHLIYRSATNKLADLMPARAGTPQREPTPEQARLIRLMHLEEPHPDLANPPVYPFLLAGMLKVSPYDYVIPASTQRFQVYRPDLWIAFLNQALFILAGILTFGLARRLFDEPVAWISTAVLLCAELLWRFTVSGLSTTFLLVLVLAVVRLLVWIDQAAREANPSGVPVGDDVAALTGAPAAPATQSARAGLIFRSLALGVLAGLAGLTRYSMGFLIVPVAAFLATVPSRRRGVLTAAAVAAFLAVMTPWVVRNLLISGAPFGTAGFAVFQGTAWFPDDEMERTLNPYFGGLAGGDYFSKLLNGAREILQGDLPKLGGSWVSAFFLVGLLVPFRNPTLGRLRWFVAGSLALFLVVQALGRTNLTKDSPEVNSENLLVVFVPLVWMFGVGLFFLLIEQLAMPYAGRYTIIGAFWLVSSAPLVFVFLSPPPSALAYPPYYPPWIQDKTSWLDEKELLMSDIPWATAWYGGQQSVWWSLKLHNKPTDRWKNDFQEINDYVKRISGLYLSAKTMKTVESEAVSAWGHFAEVEAGEGRKDERATLWRWVEGEGSGEWAGFIMQALVQRQVPTGFPLRAAPRGVIPELFLTDSERISRESIKSP